METDIVPSAADRGLPRFVQWARRVGLGGKLALTLVIAAAAAGIATYATWSGGASPTGGRRIQILLLVAPVLLLGLGAVVARPLVRVLIERALRATSSRPL